MGGRGVMRTILRVSILTYLDLTVSMGSASARAAALSMVACRSRARADDNGNALSAEIVILSNLFVEEVTSIKDGTCFFTGCTILTSGGGVPTPPPDEESEGGPEVWYPAPPTRSGVTIFFQKTCCGPLSCRGAPVPCGVGSLHPAAVAGAAVVIPARVANPTVAAIAPATPTTVAATTVSAAAVAGAVDIGGLVRQIVGVLRRGGPEDTLGYGRVGTPERVTEGAHDDGEVLSEV